jgi:Tfp pilus assembly protein PilF
VDTPQGLRCSVDTMEVRPFWGRASLYYGTTLVSVYLAVALTAFAFLRTVGYPISIVHLVWPGSWHRVGQVRGWFFMDRANRAFAAGKPAEGMLYLRNAYEFDPANPTVALVFAQKLQLSQHALSDQIYRRLLREDPTQRAAVAQLWFRALLARGDFAAVQELAANRAVSEPTEASVWMRALIVATRETGDRAPLEQLLAASHAAATPWHGLLRTELALRDGRQVEARQLLARRWDRAPGYALYYQLTELIRLGEGVPAVDLAQAYGPQLDDTARVTALLEAYATLGLDQSRHRLVASLLEAPPNGPTMNLLCAHLVRHPEPALFDQLYRRAAVERLPFTDATLQTYVGLYCTAGANGAWSAMHELAARMQPKGGNSLTLGFVEAFFRGETTQIRATSMLPPLPLSLEMTYALIERYPGPRPRRGADSP